MDAENFAKVDKLQKENATQIKMHKDELTGVRAEMEKQRVTLDSKILSQDTEIKN